MPSGNRLTYTTMAPTGFRFMRILRLKTQLRKVAQDEIARVRQDLANLEKSIGDAETAQARNRAAATEAALEGRTAGDLQLHEIYDQGQQAYGRALRRQADALGEVIQVQRGILLERRREERQFECLESRQNARKQVTEARNEANLQDDLARRMRRAQRGRGKAIGREKESENLFTSGEDSRPNRQNPKVGRTS